MPEPVPEEVLSAWREVDALTRARADLVRTSGARGAVDLGAVGRLDRDIATRLDRVRELLDPCDAAADVPVVMLPVRLETRYADQDGAVVLQVRIYPDDIHVDDLVRGLSPEEVSAGRAYWTTVWADPSPGSAAAAFDVLLAAVSPVRAEWVAAVCSPTNLAERGTGTPTFTHPDPQTSRNIVARALPDRFRVVVEQGRHRLVETGAVVPRDLALSPIALAGDEPGAATASRLSVPEGAEWLVDFERAVAVGMAVTVQLPDGRAPIRRVVAVGTRSSSTPATGAAELEDLLLGHRYGGGLGLLAQGTPTNNADGERSPYRSRPVPSPPPVDPPAAVPGSDADAAAGVLGIDPSLLTALVGPGTDEQRVARSTNVSVWDAGWGAYLDMLDNGKAIPGLTDAQRESARRLFRDHVRGRGPSPALRVRNQVYGVLPASDLGNWEPRRGETTAGLLGVVRGLLERWRTAADTAVDRLRPDQEGLDEALLEVLGSSPVMLGLRARPFISGPLAETTVAATGVDAEAYAAERFLRAAVMAEVVQASIANQIAGGSLDDDDRPLPLPLASERDPEFIAALLASPSRVLEVDSVLQALLALAWQSTEMDAAVTAPAQALPELMAVTDLSADLTSRTSGLLGRVDRADSSEFLTLATAVEEATNVPAAGPAELRRHHPGIQASTSLAEVVLAAPEGASRRLLAGATVAGWLLNMGHRAEVREAMQHLATRSVADRALALAETLDCHSHRLDAWVTAIVAERRSLQSTRRGLTLGAWGVVEDLLPQDGSQPDGWLHAPSTQHATAAGILRNAHVAHQPGTGDPGPFALDLSSVRLDRAVHVLDGVRSGQQLTALVGYQIERGLAEAGLARLQLSLRALAPLVAERLHESAPGDAGAREVLAATDVVDGLALLEQFPPGDTALRSRLDVVPANVYLDPGDWHPLTGDEWATVTGILREAADTVDAVADVMLSEAVLQYAGGNPGRAAAAMDAMGPGASPASEIDVLDTHEPGERLTHRVLALVGGSATTGWTATRPRALAEPRLEAWAAAHLGSADTIVVVDAAEGQVTLDAAGWAALDLVHAGDQQALELSLRQALDLDPGAVLAVRPGEDWSPGQRSLGQVVGLATTLRALLAGGTPLLPDTLARPGEKPTRDLGPALAELHGRLSAAAGSLAAAVSTLQPTMAAIPDDGVVDDQESVDGVAAALVPLHAYGVVGSPAPSRPLDVSWARAAWETAEARAANATALLAQIGADLAAGGGAAPGVVLDRLGEAAETVFGDGFVVAPLLPAPAEPDDLVLALGAPVFPQPARSAVRRLVRDLGTVREQVGRYSEVLLVGSALEPAGHSAQQPAVAQLSARAGSQAAPGTEHWLAGPLPEQGPWPTSSVAHLVVDAVGVDDGDEPLAGLVIDAWVEELPDQPEPPRDPANPRPDELVAGTVRTGLAVRSHAASARAPQVVLSAISPDGERWGTDSLVSMVTSTVALAKVRLLRLDQLPGDGLTLPALYVRSASLQGEEVFDFATLAEARSSFSAMPYVKEVD